MPDYGNPFAYVPEFPLIPGVNAAPSYGTQELPLDVFYGAGGTTGNKTTNKDLPEWLRNLGMKGDAYAGGMLKPEIRYGFKYKDGKIYFADGRSFDAKKVKDKKTKQVTYQYTDADGKSAVYDPTDEQDAYNKKYQNATANQSFVDKLGATADRTRAHVHDILGGAKDALRGKGSIFGGTPLGTKLSNMVTGRNDKPITDQYGGPTKESQAKYVEEHGANALGYQPQLHAVGSAIGSYFGGQALAGAAGSAFSDLADAAGGAAGQAVGGASGASGLGAGSLAGAGGAGGSWLQNIPGIAGNVTGGGSGASSGSAGLGGLLSGGGTGMDWLDAALNLYGIYSSSQGAKDARNDLARASQQLTTTLGGSVFSTPGGGGAALLPNGAGGSFGLGDLESTRALLSQFAGQQAERAGNTGLPQNVADALTGVQGASGVPGLPNTDYLSNAADSTLLRSMFDMNRGSVAPGLANSAFAGAAQNLGDAGRGFGDVRDSVLSNLRAQAQPFETRAYDTLQNDLFSTGRLGSSGGALQTEAFARGLGQADLQRQLTANNEARLTQQNALGVGQGLAGVGQNIAGLDENLLNSAFSRFGQSANLAQGLAQERFGNSVLLNNTGFDRAQANLQNQIGAAQLPLALQGSNLALALQGLQGQGFLQDQGLQQFQAALAQAQAAANARIGSGSNVAALQGLRAQLPSSSDIWGQALTGISARTGNQTGNGSLSGLFGGLFGSSPKSIPTPVNNPYGNDPRAQGY